MFDFIVMMKRRRKQITYLFHVFERQTVFQCNYCLSKCQIISHGLRNNKDANYANYVKIWPYSNYLRPGITLFVLIPIDPMLSADLIITNCVFVERKAREERLDEGGLLA